MVEETEELEFPNKMSWTFQDKFADESNALDDEQLAIFDHFAKNADEEEVLLVAWLGEIRLKMQREKISRVQVASHFSFGDPSTVSHWWRTSEIKTKYFARLILLDEFKDVRPLDLTAASIRLWVTWIRKNVLRQECSRILQLDELLVLGDAHVLDDDSPGALGMALKPVLKEVGMTVPRLEKLLVDWGPSYRLFVWAAK